MRIHRPFIFFTCLALAALAILKGVLVLVHGVDSASTQCWKLCGIGFAIRQYFGWRAYEVAIAMVNFGAALLIGHAALSAGTTTKGVVKPRRRRGRKRRRKAPSRG